MQQARELNGKRLCVAVAFQDLPTAALWWRLHRDDLGPWRARGDAERGKILFGDLLLLRLHDPGETRVARLFGTLVDQPDHRRGRGPHLVTTLDLAPQLHAVAACGDLGEHPHVWPA